MIGVLNGCLACGVTPHIVDPETGCCISCGFSERFHKLCEGCGGWRNLDDCPACDEKFTEEEE